MKTTIEVQNGFVAELTGDYYKLTYKGETIYQDSACEDCYDEDSAEAFFNDMIESIGERGQNVIKRSIDLGYKNNKFNDLEVVENYCEDFLFSNIDSDYEEQCDLHTSGYSQFYNYDGNNCSGEIFDFSDTITKMYYKDADFKQLPVAEYEIEEEERDRYAFIFDRVIDDDAKVVSLYDYLA